MRLTRASAYWASAALVVLSALAGCGSNDSHGTHPKSMQSESAKPSAPSRPVHDPPATFATGHPVSLPEQAIAGRLTAGGTLNAPLPVTLYKSTAFVATTTQMQAMDTATGRITATVTPELTPVETGNGWNDTNHADAPLLVTGHGTPTVIAPFVVKRTGTGTQASNTVVEVIGTSADTGKAIWHLTLRLPEWATEDDPEASVIGADNGIAVIRVSTFHHDHAAAYGIDLDGPRQAWGADKFQASAVTDQTVAGALLEDDIGIDQRPAGFDLATGKRLWQGPLGDSASADSAGPRQLRVHGKDYENGHYDRLADPRTGRTLQTLPADLAGSTCTYDDRSMLICYGMGAASYVVYGLKPSTGKVAWRLPDRQADRIAPKITTAWHGRVYGTTDNGAVALDARTGKDLPGPRVAPLLVDESAGIVLGDSSLLAYTSSG
ncbi:PQQ-binding-like beta-propeller repeat protein [Streptomyces sp. NPDC015171]|uniref:outer membrane protein assembly factor BamB family protein n=1 Tax=Streptomyces sp. NPDC015171 TaxID=3364945 RepID=UPI0036FB6223